MSRRASPSSTNVNACQKLPHDLQAEMACLGAMMLNPDMAALALREITEDHFYRISHQNIFKAIEAVMESGKPADDMIIIRDELKRQDALEKIGGQQYLMQLCETVTVSSNCEYYVYLLKDAYAKREVMRVAYELRQKAPSESDIEALLEDAARALDQVNRPAKPITVPTISDHMRTAAERMEAKARDELDLLTTGINPFDRRYGGLEPGEYMIVAAYRSVGKTALMNHVVHHVTHVLKQPVVVFSAEVVGQRYAVNFARRVRQADFTEIKGGTFGEDIWEDWRAAQTKIEKVDEDAPLFVDDTGGIAVEDLAEKAQRLVRDEGVELICADYAQLLESTQRFKSENLRIAHTSRVMKALANNTGVPVVVLSQRTEREGRRRTYYAPQLEHDADIVAYLEYGDPAHKNNPEDEPPRCERTLAVTKHRDKGTGKAFLVFDKPTLTFWEKGNAPPEATGKVSGENTINDSELPF